MLDQPHIHHVRVDLFSMFFIRLQGWLNSLYVLFMNANGWLKYGGSTIANYHPTKERCIVGLTNFASLKQTNNLFGSL
jgi:hypothetical protein